MRVVGWAVARFGARNRARKARFAAAFITTHDVRSVLFVGVNASPRPLENLTERTIMQLAPGLRYVASGLAAPEELDGRWPEYAQADALDLPFADREFDLVFSNAVIEHVGQEPEQRRFVEEHARVGKHWILTTPNRAFPVESHSHHIVRHWSPRWTHHTVSRLLTYRDLARLVQPLGGRIHGHPASPTFTAASR